MCGRQWTTSAPNFLPRGDDFSSRVIDANNLHWQRGELLMFFCLLPHQHVRTFSFFLLLIFFLLVFLLLLTISSVWDWFPAAFFPLLFGIDYSLLWNWKYVTLLNLVRVGYSFWIDLGSQFSLIEWMFGFWKSLRVWCLLARLRFFGISQLELFLGWLGKGEKSQAFCRQDGFRETLLLELPSHDSLFSLVERLFCLVCLLGKSFRSNQL